MQKIQTNKKVGTKKRVSVQTQLKLWIRTGGRCSFRGCNKNLQRDGLTLQETNLANIAHIVAASLDGPRGNDLMPLKERAEIQNLMLVCRDHHKLIDSNETRDRYPKKLLLEMKNEHEARIGYLTSLVNNKKSFLVKCKANILGEIIQVSEHDIHAAIFPDYFPMKGYGIEIDLVKTLGMDSIEYYDVKKQEINLLVNKYLEPHVMAGDIDHISLFALGPMPLLAYLGSVIPNKIETRFFSTSQVF